MMQAPVAEADTFQHLPDTLVRGVTASLPGGPKVTGVIVIALILAINVILILAAFRGFKAAGGIKAYLADFPSHNASTGLALILIGETAIVVLIRLALGLVFPDNYDTWIWALVGLAGVNVAGLGLKRFSDVDYMKEKVRAKQAGGSGVNVEGNANITTEQPVPVIVPTKGPSFGGKSR